MAQISKTLLDAAGRKVVESFNGRKMIPGEQVLVIFNECSLLYTVDKERNLKIEINPEKPIVFTENLFEEA